MAKPQCSVEICTDRDHTHRAVGFLVYDGVKYVDAKPVFDGFGEDTQNYFRKSFDLWIGDPFKGRPERYHGWDKNEFGGRYVEIFVFKNPPHRFYGFLCHPKEPKDKRFQLCVLALHAEKYAAKTDETNLKRAEALRKDINVQGVLKKLFP